MTASIRLTLLAIGLCSMAAGGMTPSAHLYFEPDSGQTGGSAQFYARTDGQTAFLAGTEAVLQSRDTTRPPIRIQLKGGRSLQAGQGENRLPGLSHYLLGNDPSRWRRNVPHFAKVRFRDVYPGIDIVYYGNGSNLEYDFVVAPGADPNRIQLSYSGMDQLQRNAQGDLVLTAGNTQLVQHRPRVYQMVPGGKTQQIASNYTINRDGGIQFALGRYDRNLGLTIDPTLDYSQYFGGPGYDVAIAVAVDAQGSAYVTGTTTSINFPSQSVQQQLGGGADAFIAKYNPVGDSLQFITYLGGHGNDTARSIALDGANNIYVSGETGSVDFPVASALQNNFGGGETDAFVTKLSAAGDRFLYSTFIGGGANDFGNGLAVDTNGNAFLTGWTRSSDFPVTAGAFQTTPAGGGADAFVLKLGPTGNQLVYSTLLGGDGQDFGTGLAIDAAGNAYVTGSTASNVFPTVNPLQPKNAGGISDAYISKLSPDGKTLLFSTFFGGSAEDLGYRIAVDSGGNIVVSGYTYSSNFPVKNAAQPNWAGGSDVFVAKFAPSGSAVVFATYLGGSADDGSSVVFSTFLGGGRDEFGFGGLALDSAGNIYVSGYTSSTDFPTRSAFQQSFGGGTFDAFVAKYPANGSALAYSSFLGGSGEDESYGLAVDQSRGNVYVVGRTMSPNFPKARNTLNASSTDFDAFVSRIAADLNTPVANVSPTSLTFTAQLGAPDPAAQPLSITSSGAPLNFATVANSRTPNPWLFVDLGSGNTPASLQISVRAAGLAPGTYQGNITLNLPSASNSPLVVPVTLNVTAVPVILSVSPSTITAGSNDTAVTITGTGFSAASTVTVNGRPVGASFVNPTTFNAFLPASFLTTAGTLQLVVTGSAGNSASFPIAVGAIGPSATGAGVVNAATARSGAVAPGEFITIYGSNFGLAAPGSASLDASGNLSTRIAQTRVLFDGVPAPLSYAGKGQVNAIVPYSVAGQSSTSVTIEEAGVRSGVIAIQVVPSSPGIYTANASGGGQAVAVNQDGTINSTGNPAPRGSIVTLYATGEGVTNPAEQTGQITAGSQPFAPVLPVSLKVGGADAELLYAAEAPGQVAGVLQVNARIPTSVPAGSNIPLVLVVGGVASRLDVTIALQ